MSELSDSGNCPSSPMPGRNACVIDENGQHAEILHWQHAEGGSATVLLRTADGREVSAPAAFFSQPQGEGYVIPVSFENLLAGPSEQAKKIIPVMQEELHVGKRTVDRGSGVRIRKKVNETEKIVDMPLKSDEATVDRVPIGKLLENGTIPAPRYEGNTLVIPVVEEILVIEKRIRLVEEIRVTKRQHEKQYRQAVVLKRESAEIERFGNDPDSPS